MLNRFHVHWAAHPSRNVVRNDKFHFFYPLMKFKYCLCDVIWCATRNLENRRRFRDLINSISESCVHMKCSVDFDLAWIVRSKHSTGHFTTSWVEMSRVGGFKAADCMINIYSTPIHTKSLHFGPFGLNGIFQAREIERRSKKMPWIRNTADGSLKK